jgi:hypothetical protein
MPIEITCPKCQKRLSAPDAAKGKRVKCPQCQDILVVPGAEATSEKAASPSGAQTSSTPAERWYVKTGDGTDYGPISRAELDSWFQERRLNAKCQVLRDGADQWQWASDLYPQLEATTATAPATSPVTGPATASPFDFLNTPSNPSPVGPAFQQPATQSYPMTPVAGKGYTGGAAPYYAAGNPYAASQYSAAPYSPGAADYGLSDKSKVAAGILGLLLGAYGVHRFYLGYVGIGLTQIAVTIVTCGIGGLWGFIEGIMILAGTFDRDAHGRKLRD